MTIWYRYICQDCGYSGLTRQRERYLQARTVCPRCGSFRFEVQETDAAPLPDEDALVIETNQD
jgi:Zn finger protein HypA/HybF involved in hydrogenase expression